MTREQKDELLATVVIVVLALAAWSAWEIVNACL